LLSRQIDTKDHKMRYQYLFTTLQSQLKKSKESKQIESWQQSTVIDWANESLKLTISEGLSYCRMHHGNCQRINQQPLVLADNYQTVYSKKLNMRIVQASVRLAHLLEQSL